MGYGEIFTKEIMFQLRLKEKKNLSVRQNGQHKLQDEELMRNMDLLENVFYNCWANESTEQYGTVEIQVLLQEGYSIV